jgi:hypothetical protein
MSTQKWRYFVTDDDLMLKTGKMVYKAKELRDRLTKLGDELKEFSSSWKELGQQSSDWRGRSFQIGENSLRILNPSRNMCEIATVPWAHFDVEKVKHLFGDIQQTKDALDEVEAKLSALGI